MKQNETDKCDTKISETMIGFNLPVFKQSLPLLSQFLTNIYITQLLDEPEAE